MSKLSYENHDGVPVFRCSACGQCSGIETENVFGANRGCCFYFPKYTLMDLRTVAAIDPGFPERLRKHPGAVIADDHIVIRGHYDQDAHEAFRRDPDARTQDKYRSFDTSLLFRKCSLCTETGCAIEFRLRPHPCNLYLCRDVIERCSEPGRAYARERKDYFAYCHYMNEMLADELSVRGLSLTRDFTGTIVALLETDVGAFECSDLPPIEF